ncbi:MAG: DUF1080 domain-containing protein [Opitutaceae bacterium]|nr:DUF1080 domain-containing protein [Opitutaceae bacterium]
MTRIAVAFFIPGVATLFAAETASFVPAQPNPAIGDWQGGGFVAQVFTVDGRWQANLLHAFDEPDAKPIAVLNGTALADEVALSGGGWNGTIRDGRFTARQGSNPIVFRHLTRPLPTLGAKPPPGAVVLFDGRNLDAWAAKSGKDWLKEAGPAPWKIVDGAAEIVPATESLISHRQFGDAHVHLEFRTLGAPTNSGVYLQTRYEVNINETYGRFDANPCGGLDNCSDVKPRVRASRPPLEWQTLDIDFVAPRFDATGRKSAPARATVRLNGVTLYDRQELNPPKGAAGRLGEAPRGPLMLQEHGQPVQFRNIWVAEAK